MPAKNSVKDSLIAVVGPTSSGKSELAVVLAKKYHGEIISCDSRQIYKGLNIGTGKVPGKLKMLGGRRLFVYKGVVHHLIDVANPRRQSSVALFQTKAAKAIKEIKARGLLPILCGGTGHYIDAVVFGQQFPEVKPNTKLRAKLDKLTANELFLKLKKIDPARAKNIDRHNKRRLVRALEIVISTGKPVPARSQKYKYDALWVGINLPQKELFAKIKKRLVQRLKQGLLHEIKKLHKQGVSWQRLEQFGLEYKFGSLYLQGKLNYDQMLSQLLLAIQNFSKRQNTWFKRNKNIHWIANPKQAATLIAKFF